MLEKYWRLFFVQHARKPVHKEGFGSCDESIYHENLYVGLDLVVPGLPSVGFCYT